MLFAEGLKALRDFGINLIFNQNPQLTVTRAVWYTIIRLIREISENKMTIQKIVLKMVSLVLVEAEDSETLNGLIEDIYLKKREMISQFFSGLEIKV